MFAAHSNQVKLTCCGTMHVIMQGANAKKFHVMQARAGSSQNISPSTSSDPPSASSSSVPNQKLASQPLPRRLKLRSHPVDCRHFQCDSKSGHATSPSVGSPLASQLVSSSTGWSTLPDTGRQGEGAGDQVPSAIPSCSAQAVIAKHKALLTTSTLEY